MYFLIDCNQFFVSCEQVFAPKLKNRPVVVLSNNDGCVVARSKQAKALGIPMGAPAYQCHETFERHKVIALSSNYALYADMSQRVMTVLEGFSNDLEIYSIDEAFLLSEENNPSALANIIRKTVIQCTGIPVSIGIAKTKTLAKLAGELAKNDPSGVFLLSEPETTLAILKKAPVAEIWGIGRNLEERLRGLRIFTAWELAQAEKEWLKKQFSIMVQRTSLELQGISCIGLEESPEQQHSIIRSRSFGKPVTALEELKEALAMHTAKATSKLRQQRGVCRVISVFLTTSRFLQQPYAVTLSQAFSMPTAYTPHLIAKAHELLENLYRSNLVYKKVGVTLSEIRHKKDLQGDFWEPSLTERTKHTRAMKVVDELQRTFGSKALRFAAEGVEQPWAMRRGNCSPHYTTSWEELLEI